MILDFVMNSFNMPFQMRAVFGLEGTQMASKPLDFRVYIRYMIVQFILSCKMFAAFWASHHSNFFFQVSSMLFIDMLN